MTGIRNLSSVRLFHILRDTQIIKEEKKYDEAILDHVNELHNKVVDEFHRRDSELKKLQEQLTAQPIN